MISLQDDSAEWEKIRHVQQVKAYGKRYTEDSVDRHIFYTKEPCSFEAVMGEPTGTYVASFALLLHISVSVSSV